ncbi:ATPase [Vibrio tubiashii]|nr:ATPase [Vibrio tubiashii]
MTVTKDYFSQLLEIAAKSNHRIGVVVRGNQHWQQQCLEVALSVVVDEKIFFLGGEAPYPVGKSVGFNKGQQLLGQECQLLCCDFRDGFDANSFTAATGCVVGGGLVLILTGQQTHPTLGQAWLNNALQKLLTLEQGNELILPSYFADTVHPNFDEQALAIAKIRKVVEGHRKRPLVLTADRGRGKSSALGIAAAELIQQRSIHIVVTAPTLATIQPVFEHAKRLLPQANLERGRLEYQQSVVEFIAPDELLRSGRVGDCLFVDEASAIPIPMLQNMVEVHHRAVFSTTIHGYEGCGRGFTIKFQSWLKQQRPGAQFLHISQPIRWSQSDPLEQWLFDTFLLNAELGSLAGTETNTPLVEIDKQQLLAEPSLLEACFALLVNAHYQTSPNDLMLLLDDEAIQLHAVFDNNQCLGCMLTVVEGQFDDELVEQVLLGKRRPRGHMVPTMMAGQFGIAEAATESSIRIMRIAVHPERQRSGLGSTMVSQLMNNHDHSYCSTSFGATEELVQFWHSCGFTPIKLGSQRDQASGTYSIVMANGRSSWLETANRHFAFSLHYSVSELHNEIETELLRSLIVNTNASVDDTSVRSLLMNYCSGGSSYEAVIPFIDNWWKSSPRRVDQVSGLFIRKIIQRWSWERCQVEFGYTGQKQTEFAFKQHLHQLLQH